MGFLSMALTSMIETWVTELLDGFIADAQIFIVPVDHSWSQSHCWGFSEKPEDWHCERSHFGDGSTRINTREKLYLGGEKHMDGPQGFDVLTHFILISKVSMIPEFRKVEIPEMLREPFWLEIFMMLRISYDFLGKFRMPSWRAWTRQETWLFWRSSWDLSKLMPGLWRWSEASLAFVDPLAKRGVLAIGEDLAPAS
jgi:hypothetical protein